MLPLKTNSAFRVQEETLWLHDNKLEHSTQVLLQILVTFVYPTKGKESMNRGDYINIFNYHVLFEEEKKNTRLLGRI